jgi:hypothetical protein
MALDILTPIAEFVGNVVFGIRNWKRQGTFPTISVFVAGLVFLFLGGMSALVVVAMVPQWHRIAIVLVVFVGAIVLPMGAQKAGLKLGFQLTPVRSTVLATFAAVGTIGTLYLEK